MGREQEQSLQAKRDTGRNGTDLKCILPASRQLLFSQEVEFYINWNSTEWRGAVSSSPWLYLLISVRTHEYFIVWLITRYRFEVLPAQ